MQVFRVLWVEEKNYISERLIVPIKSQIAFFTLGRQCSMGFIYTSWHILSLQSFQGCLQTSSEARVSPFQSESRSVSWSSTQMSSSWDGLLAMVLQDWWGWVGVMGSRFLRCDSNTNCTPSPRLRIKGKPICTWSSFCLLCHKLFKSIWTL